MNLISEYQKKINNIITNEIILKHKNKKIRDIYIHSLAGGKRLRSIISLNIYQNMIVKKENINIEKELCLIVELFHNSCLIIDDLPMMDNDEYRRNKKSVWYKYGILNSHLITNLMLFDCLENINLIIKKLNDNKHYSKKKINNIKSRVLNNYFGNIKDASYGQFLDIYPILNDNFNFSIKIEENLLRKVITAKTAPFFEIAFVLPCLFLDSDDLIIEKLKKSSLLFGLIYQISDDFIDQKQDSKKNSSIIQNYVLVVGEEKARLHFNIFMKEFKNIMLSLDLYSSLIDAILSFLSQRVNKNSNYLLST